MPVNTIKMKPEETIDYHIKVAWQNIVNKYNSIAVGYDFSQAMGYILLMLEEDKGHTVSELANKIGVKNTSLSRLLQNLEELALIKRNGNNIDKRSVLVFLTPLGTEKQKVVKKVVRSFNEYLDKHVSIKEKENLIKTINKINTLALEFEFKD